MRFGLVLLFCGAMMADPCPTQELKQGNITLQVVRCVASEPIVYVSSATNGVEAFGITIEYTVPDGPSFKRREWTTAVQVRRIGKPTRFLMELPDTASIERIYCQELAFVRGLVTMFDHPF